MKKFSVILMAIALVMGLTQCKKENQNGNGGPVLQGEEVTITLLLSNGSSAKSDVLPDDDNDIAPVKFTAGDVIWVAYDGKNVGSITYSPSSALDQNGNALGVFTGDINIAQNGDKPLYFYFLGNKQPEFTLDNQGAGIGYTVDLSDQSSGLPVISYGISEQTYPSSNNKYTVKYNWLKNQCALVKFEMENIYNNDDNVIDDNDYAIYTTTKPITIYGMKNQVTINLANPATSADQLWGTSPDWNHTLDASFTWSKKDGDNGDNTILLYSPSADEEVVRYAIVAPETYSTQQGKLDVPFDASSDNYGFFGTYKLNGSVANNAYYQDAKIDLVWHSGAFSVSATEKVVFSRGNLQYAHRGASTNDGGTWRFAKHQYDWVGGKVGLSSTRQGNVALNEEASATISNDADYSNNENISASGYNGWIDLFGYGTGDDPMKYTTVNSDYNDWHEWGEHNIVNSGKPDATGWWVTMKHNEWSYLLDDRTNATTKIGAAQINTGTAGYVKGLILLPDKWNGPSITALTWSSTGSGTNLTWTCHGDCTDNKYTSEALWLEMERYGAVFLPAAGYRDGDDYDGGTATAQNRGCYWASTMSTAAAAWSFRFEDLTTSSVFSFTENYPMAPDNGHAVRLVHRIETNNTGAKFFNKKD